MACGFGGRSVPRSGGCCTLVPMALHGRFVAAALFAPGHTLLLFVQAAFQKFAHGSYAGLLLQQRLAPLFDPVLRRVELTLLQRPSNRRGGE